MWEGGIRVPMIVAGPKIEPIPSAAFRLPSGIIYPPCTT